ncbi:helix-turn-helix domain-containing protein [Acinetobacter junii]|uniref:helix-turn-helix domain-containing protein n=1 Tax=Acinetobacter junii TaxID=40215 RepID=UPI00124D9EEE|nr:helix-turn-helix domain-containing protein [Acinetobacter junii]
MSTHTEIFDNMIYVLSQFAQSDKALNTDEVAYRLDMSRRTAQRLTKSLTESGWLGFKKVGCSKLYFANDKTKELFGGAK